MTSMELIPFHGDALTYVERDGVPYVALKPISERLGLKWSSQHAKISAQPELWGIRVIGIPSAGGEQETTCLPVNRIAFWLGSIHPSKVRPELREALIRYQIEAADVLDRHFRQKLDETSLELADLRAALAHCHAHLLASSPKWSKIKLLLEAGAWWPLIAKRCNLSYDMARDEGELMRSCGLIVGDGTDTKMPPSSLDRIRELEDALSFQQAKAAMAAV